MSRLPALVHVLKLGNGQLAEMMVDDRVAAAVRQLAITMMAPNTPQALTEACALVGRAIAGRLDALEEKDLKTLPWSRRTPESTRASP